jgi:predicted metal-dependent hydrolase
MHLEIDDDGGLRVVVPQDWPDFYTRRLLRKHLDKVRRFLHRARTRALEPLRYADGAIHLFRGREMRLRIQARSPRASAPALSDDTLFLPVPDTATDRIRDKLNAWYRVQAESLFAERLAHWQRQASWASDRKLQLRLRRMRKTWGTCSSAGVIRLNTHLVKAPPACLDYVIAHELCHVKEMNHGPAFYALQERLFPDWREQRAHLRAEGARYTQE